MRSKLNPCLCLSRRKILRRLVIALLLIVILICIVLFVVVPLAFRYSYAFQRSMLFLSFVKSPLHMDFDRPEDVGLLGTRNFYLRTNDSVSLGVWHILPTSLVPPPQHHKNATWYESQLGGGKPVVLYMHGSGGSRASAPRVRLYQVLRSLDYHVIAFDYRSFGDSSAEELSETGTVADGKFVYKWIANKTRGIPLFVWGHSLGTGISSHVVSLLEEEGVKVRGLILEAPFSNMRDELHNHPYAKLFTFLPWFEQCFVDPPYENELKFDSDQHVSKMLAPVHILHAEDDRVVPFHLGYKLYKTVLQNRSENALPVDFTKFPGKYGYGHNFISRDPSLPKIIRNFVLDNIRKSKNAKL